MRIGWVAGRGIAARRGERRADLRYSAFLSLLLPLNLDSHLRRPRPRQLLDHLETILNPPDAPASTGFILDHHAPSLFPERWVDLAVVLQCENGVLYERLEERCVPEWRGRWRVASSEIREE